MSDSPISARAVFTAALAIEDPAARGRFLDQACQNQPTLRRRVESLLRAHRDAGRFLESAALGLPPSPAREVPGSIIGHYRLLEVIGEGGFGVVYRAEQTEPVKRQVALKIVKLGMDTRQVIARFEAERQALALMDHPNIAKVLDAGSTEAGRPYFVMELAEGVPLTDYCDQHQCTTAQRLELFQQVCGAVQHAHQKGIIHRDLKPSNILVVEPDGQPVPKVIDFGVAKAIGQKLTEKTLLTLEHQFLGTPVYCSPEQVDPAAQDVDTRADIYSLGVVLYELLTGKTPFDAEHLKQAGWNEVVRIVREQDPPKPSTRLTAELAAADGRHAGVLAGRVGSHKSPAPSSEPDQDNRASRRLLRTKETVAQLRGDLDWIVMKALEKDRNRRYASTSTLALDIERYLNHEPVEAAAPSVAYRAGKFIRRHRLGVVAGGAIAVALVLGTVVSYWQATEANAARSKEEQARLAAQANRREAEALVAFLVDELTERFENMGVKDLQLAVVTRATNYFARLPKNEPLSPDQEYNRSLALAGIGRLHRTAFNDSLGWPYYAEAITTMERLVTQYPDRSEWQRGLASACIRYGHTLQQSDDPKDRIEGYRIQCLGLKTITNLLARAPKDFEAQGIFGLVLYELGRFSPEDMAQKLEHTRTAREILRSLFEKNPQNDQWRYGLVRIYTHHAWLLEQQKDFAEALPEYEEGIRILREGIQFAGENMHWKIYLVEGLVDCANAYRQISTPENLALAYRRLDEAEALWEELRQQRRLVYSGSVQALALYEAMLARYEATDPERALGYARRAWERVFSALETETIFRASRKQYAAKLFVTYSGLLVKLQKAAQERGDEQGAQKLGQELKMITERNATLSASPGG